MINWDAVELAITPKPVLFSLGVKQMSVGFAPHIKFFIGSTSNNTPPVTSVKKKGKSRILTMS